MNKVDYIGQPVVAGDIVAGRNKGGDSRLSGPSMIIRFTATTVVCHDRNIYDIGNFVKITEQFKLTDTRQYRLLMDKYKHELEKENAPKKSKVFNLVFKLVYWMRDTWEQHEEMVCTVHVKATNQADALNTARTTLLKEFKPQTNKLSLSAYSASKPSHCAKWVDTNANTAAQNHMNKLISSFGSPTNNISTDGVVIKIYEDEVGKLV